MAIRALALVVGLAALASSPSLASAQEACPAPTLATLWPAIPADARTPFDDDLTDASARAVLIELDGPPPAEALLARDHLEEYEGPDSQSGLWALRCRAGAWSFVGRAQLDIDAGWDGTFDTRPGIVVLRAEPLPGVGHDFARIEQMDVRGSYDPRFISRRLVLLHVVGDEVVVAFDAVVRHEITAGPAREDGDTYVRSVVYRRTTPPQIRFRVRVISAEGRTRSHCSTILTFDGRTFVRADPGCL